MLGRLGVHLSRLFASPQTEGGSLGNRDNDFQGGDIRDGRSTHPEGASSAHPEGSSSADSEGASSAHPEGARPLSLEHRIKILEACV